MRFVRRYRPASHPESESEPQQLYDVEADVGPGDRDSRGPVDALLPIVNASFADEVEDFLRSVS